MATTLIMGCMVVLLSSRHSWVSGSSSYDEYISITKSLDTKYLIYHFSMNQFHRESAGRHDDDVSFSQSNLYPYILDKYDLKNLQVTMTRGRYHYRDWGLLKRKYSTDGSENDHNESPFISMPPSGLTVKAQFNNSNQTTSSNIKHKWDYLVNELSGLFCASINFLTFDSRRVYDSGIVNFMNHDIGKNDHSTTTIYGTLSEETVCTENLTPFKSILPYRGNRGISALLIPKLLFDSDYVSLVLDITRRGIFMNVFRVIKYNEGNEYENFKFITFKKTKLQIPYGNSHIYVNGADNELQDTQKIATNSPADKTISISTTNNYLLKRIVNEMNDTGSDHAHPLNLNIYNVNNIKSGFEQVVPSRVHVMRYQLDNKLITNIEIFNNSDTGLEKENYCLYDVIPWYFKTFIHTLKIDGQSIDQAHKNHMIKSMNILPQKDRVNPFVMNLCFNLTSFIRKSRGQSGSSTSIQVSIEFEKTYLKYTEHAPDANRGFDLSSAIIIHSSNENPNDLYYYYSDSLLINLPTPDFSMPYNVITLTSTVIVLFYGSMFNLMIRRFNAKYEEEHTKSLLDRILGAIFRKRTATN
ncbi:hypothetical protein C9374_009155 [Naegleria lovaniensis]|uniref:GPI transamidase component GPI16 n=1 Tax=Naegleria lovaniensis TaxID=51637 RepID=A0AA88KKB6_NAELO|nr:uncharacterized protein C9374_009155 [Naegleria lovaniensis]KAG2377639.1 hypothetical protein C9374_009155 [Naegleria lovaniensis]